MTYASNAATASKLITKYGRSITLRKYSVGTYDPSTGANTTTITDSTVTGVVFDFSAGQTMERGTLIQVGDKRVLLSASAAPSLQDHVLIGTAEYTIISVGETNPGGVSVMFDIHVRT
jgi:hypothetical protein